MKKDKDKKSLKARINEGKPGDKILCTQEQLRELNLNTASLLSSKVSGKSDGSSADYYKLPPRAKQLQTLISHKDMNAQVGEIFRACYRYGECSHSDKARDMRKVIFYAKAELKRLDDLVLLDDL